MNDPLRMAGRPPASPSPCARPALAGEASPRGPVIILSDAPDDSLRLPAAWRQAGVPAELHVLADGGHGFRLTPEGKTGDRRFEDLAGRLKTRGPNGAERGLPAAADRGEIHQ
ncbi:hypothetical protein U5903_17855 [Cereibacter johrii]|uniref:hypothetical protein n=1 Tax=Cereibacter johrii TaxID=445629 RepID=UPI002B261D73|nr:hypothetical protein [Cereibacter johrii]MEA5162646.1 hypothetical protein [Cereibacter johrii]